MWVSGGQLQHQRPQPQRQESSESVDHERLCRPRARFLCFAYSHMYAGPLCHICGSAQIKICRILRTHPILIISKHYASQQRYKILITGLQTRFTAPLAPVHARNRELLPTTTANQCHQFRLLRCDERLERLAHGVVRGGLQLLLKRRQLLVLAPGRGPTDAQSTHESLPVIAPCNGSSFIATARSTLPTLRICCPHASRAQLWAEFHPALCCRQH